jgi:salicylate hydroxylase
MDERVEVAVVGGGLGGLSLAIGLLQRGVDVRVFEQADELCEIGAGVALGGNAVRLLQRLGVDLGPVANVPPAVELRRWDTGGLIWSHEIGRWYERQMGAPFYLLHRATLQRMLTAPVPSERIRLSHQLTGIVEEPGEARLRFADQPDVFARVVVGADGMHSTTRRYVAGDTIPRYSGEIGFRGLIPTAHCPGLPAPTALHLWCGPGTHVVYYGVDDGQLVNLLAVHVPDRLPAWTRTSNRRPGSRAEALALFEGYGWDERILELIRHIGGDMHFWALQELPPPRRWSRDRVVLMGDAAHAPLPHQGQGAGQAIEDAYVLGHLLAHGGSSDHQRVFDTFQRLRQGRARRVQHYSRLAGKLIKLTGQSAHARDQALPGLPQRIAWIHEHKAEETVLAELVS